VGRLDEALELSGRVTAERRRTLGAAHPDTLTSRMGMALARGAAGDVESALTLLRAALKDAEHAYGSRSEHAIALRGNVGACLALLGRAEEASAVFAQAADDAAAFFGPHHPHTVELAEDITSVHDMERFAIAGTPVPA
jgi:hypothetical protein